MFRYVQVSSCYLVSLNHLQVTTGNVVYYVSLEQSRLYLGLGRDGLLPLIFAKVHPTRHTPVHSQVWVGIVAIILAGLFNVELLSHILSVGSLVCFSLLSSPLCLKLTGKLLL